MLSEEAQETGNKVFKRVRTGHTRMMSQLSGTEDLIHWMFTESDPYLTIQRASPKERRMLTEEMKGLLKEIPIPVSTDTSDATSSDSE